MPRILILLSLILIGCQAKQENNQEENKDEVVLARPMQEKGKADKKKAIVQKKKKQKKPKTNTQDAKNVLDLPSSTDPIDYKTKDYSAFHEEAKAFCKKKRYNKDYYFLLDYSIPSGKNRFFIYDLKKGSIIDAKLVTHGACDVYESNINLWDSAKFSDRPNSHCSSKGKYKIGKRDYSGWGINVKYWIKGLEDSNKSAEKRIVVLHSWGLVSDEEIYPDYSPLSWGCPAVSDNFMTKLDGMLKQSRSPVLLWIID